MSRSFDHSYNILIDNSSTWEQVDPTPQLLEEISKIPNNDPSLNVYKLELKRVALSSRAIRLLIELLNVRLPFGVNGENPKWESVTLRYCVVAHDTLENENLVAPNDLIPLGIALANRVLNLKLGATPGLLDCLLNVPSLNMQKLSLHTEIEIDARSCERLGALVTQSMTLKTLSLRYTTFEAANLLVDSLVGAIHLESLSFGDSHVYFDTLIPIQGIETIVMTVLQLLANPQSRLKHLHLACMGLTDDQFIAITSRLHSPSSQTEQGDQPPYIGPSRLESLVVVQNGLTARSILDFARRIPELKFLKTFEIGLNPWERSERVGECHAALFRGVLQNNSIESFDSMPDMPQSELLYHRTLLKYAGRQILTASEPVPLGLWPKIFARVGNIEYLPSCRTPNFAVNIESFRADAIYFLLSEGPLKALLLHGKDAVGAETATVE